MGVNEKMQRDDSGSAYALYLLGKKSRIVRVHVRLQRFVCHCLLRSNLSYVRCLLTLPFGAPVSLHLNGV